MSATKLEFKRRWTGLDPLPDTWKEWVSVELEGLVAEWEDERSELQTRKEYVDFLGRLRRQWAIETGILERLYSVSEHATKTLIEKGLDASLIPHTEIAGREPRQVFAMIEDQHLAIESLYDFVRGERSLTTSYIKELHGLLTRHQETYEAMNSLGQQLVKPLRRGDWKDEPNGIPGEIEFCPPFSVDAEMVKLLQMYSEYEATGVSPEVLAAWLHHRFILIHPFSDGNGRVARCLATLVLLKPKRFPLVVTRDDKPAYIAALREADAGNLSPMVKLFSDLQAKAIREAFSLSEEVSQGLNEMRDILDKVTTRWQSEAEKQKQQVFTTADALHVLTSDRLNNAARQVTTAIRKWGDHFNAIRFQATRTDQQAAWYAHQVEKNGALLSYRPHRGFYHAWVALKIYTRNQTEILFSFHGMGRSTGTIACSGMIFTRQRSGEGDMAVIGEVKPICDAPFTFTHAQNPNEVAKRFQQWLDACLVRGLNEWRKVEGA